MLQYRGGIFLISAEPARSQFIGYRPRTGCIDKILSPVDVADWFDKLLGQYGNERVGGRAMFECMDQVGKLYYIYMLAQNGSIIGYYVSETRPVSVCAALTPVDDVQQSSSGSLAVTKAPGLQGTYGGSDCDRYFFFDAETKALGEVPSANMWWFDAPLAVNAPQFKVTISK